MSDNYRMILVDDEDDVRGRIISKINPESGFSVVGKAGNGYDAIELIEQFKPHVVLTDIKMPFINGIELAKIIRRDYPTTKVAFISGYDEFDYAREAIELNVVSYLMKPVTSNDIEVFLQKLKKSLDEEFDFLSNTNLIHQKYNSSIPLLINSYLSSYRFKADLTEADLSHLEQYNVMFNKGQYLVISIGVGNDNTIKDSEETKVFIGDLVEKVFGNATYQHHFLVPEGVVCIIENSVLRSALDIDIQLYEIIKIGEEYRNTNLEIGVSSVFSDFKQYPDAYRESEQALRHSKYFNMGQIIYFDDIEEKTLRHVTISDSVMNEFESSLKYGTKSEIENALSLILDHLQKDSKQFLLDPHFLMIKLANSLMNFASSIGVDTSEIFPSNLIDEMMHYRNVEELRENVIDLILKIRLKNVVTQTNKTEQIIEDVYRYIEANYQDPTISLDTITSHLNISVSYLSMLLKKLNGTSFNKQLINYRMEKAKELLKYSNEKIVNIATAVGYNEVYYFSHSFKKYSGMSPKEFRTNA